MKLEQLTTIETFLNFWKALRQFRTVNQLHIILEMPRIRREIPTPLLSCAAACDELLNASLIQYS